jgi:hypothetical protein
MTSVRLTTNSTKATAYLNCTERRGPKCGGILKQAAAISRPSTKISTSVSYSTITQQVESKAEKAQIL